MPNVVTIHVMADTTMIPATTVSLPFDETDESICPAITASIMLYPKRRIIYNRTQIFVGHQPIVYLAKICKGLRIYLSEIPKHLQESCFQRLVPMLRCMLLEWIPPYSQTQSSKQHLQIQGQKQTVRDWQE